jgi:hypothetical protein
VPEAGAGVDGARRDVKESADGLAQRKKLI